jgi:hypothetical protein
MPVEKHLTMRQAGMTHAHAIALFEGLAHYERAAELDEINSVGIA